MAISCTKLDVRKEWFPDYKFDVSTVRHLRSPRGRVTVEMVRPQQHVGMIVLCDDNSRNTRPDIGFTISVGKGVSLDVGSIVIVRPSDGTWRNSVKWGNYQAEQIRHYGVFVPHEKPGRPRIYDWTDSILATYENKVLKATGRNLLIERAKPIEKTSGGLLLPSRSIYREGEARVISAGSQCREVKEGDYILYNPRSPKKEAADLSDYEKNFAIIDEDGVEMILDESQITCEFESLQTV